jgi:unsaturated rhamnogalacturonyl hydrolase
MLMGLFAVPAALAQSSTAPIPGADTSRVTIVGDPIHSVQVASVVTGKERKASDGDAPLDPGPLATNLSPALNPTAIQTAMRKVADWQSARVADTPSQDWTYATLYAGLLSASETLEEPRYRDLVLHVAEHYQWTLGPRKTHADDQAIGQSYLWLYHQSPAPERIQPLKAQFDAIMQLPDDPAKPVWWWCDALFMAPPVWSGLASVTHDAKYLDYMNHEWKTTSSLLWDPQERLFYRDRGYFDKREKNGRKVFWSRGNGWVMGGLVRVLENLPANDPTRKFYLDKFQQMADSVAKIQSPDGLWRAGLLDAADYPHPEISGSAFFVYAIAWGINHHELDRKRFGPVVKNGWAGLVHHIYADGRLGSIQPVGEAPGAYTESSSYVFGVGAFLLAGSEVNQLSQKSGDQSR